MIKNAIDIIFGSDRSPRSQDVCASVRLSVCVIFFKRALRMALKGFLKHS